MGRVIPMVSGINVDSDKLTANRSHVLSGHTAITHDSDGDPVAGTMPDLSNKTLERSPNSADVKEVSNYWSTATGYGGDLTIEIPHSGYIERTRIQQAVYGIHPSVVKAGALIGANADTGFARGTFTSDANATADKILSGYSGYVNGVKVTGSMANQGAKTSTLNCGGSYTIPAGYHNGSGKITANSLASQTSATATAAQILSGKTAWVNGSKLTGTMKDYSYLATNQVPFDGASFSGVMAEGAEICSAADSNIQREALTIDSNGIKVYTSKTYNMYPHLCPKKSIDFSPFREIRVTGKFTGATSLGKGTMKVGIWNINVNKISMLRNYATGSLAYKSVYLEYTGVEYICIIDVSKISEQAYLTVSFLNDSGGGYPSYYIRRIEFFT